MLLFEIMKIVMVGHDEDKPHFSRTFSSTFENTNLSNIKPTANITIIVAIIWLMLENSLPIARI